MKRFMLFSYEDYYPGGGMNDLVDSFDTLDEITQWAKTVKKKDELRYTCTDNVEIYDLLEEMAPDILLGYEQKVQQILIERRL